MPLTPAVRRAARWLFASALAVYLLTTGGSMATDTMSYEVTKAMVESRSVAMSGPVLSLEAHRGVDGRYYSPYGLGHAIYSIPFYLAGRIAEVQLGFSVGRGDAVRKASFVMGSAVASALVVWIVYLFAWRLSGHHRAAVATALATAFGTLVWPYSKFGFNAPLATLTVVGAIYAVWTGVRSGRHGLIWIAGAAFGGALLVRSELVLSAGIAALWAAYELKWAWRSVGRVWIAIGVPIAAAIGVMVVYNYARFGNPLDTGYLRDAGAGFNSISKIWEGLAGLLVSPGRSLFLYSPIALAGVVALGGWFRRDRSTAWLLTAVAATFFVFYGSLEYWDADRSYGPRYLLPIVPLLCLPLVAWFAEPQRRRLMTAAVALSIAVQIPGIAVDFTKAGPALGVSHPLLERRWNWEVAGITTNTRALVHFAPMNFQYLTGLAAPPPVRPSAGRDTGFSEQFGYSFDFWWLYLFYFRKLSAIAALAIAGSLVLVALLAFRVTTNKHEGHEELKT